MKCNILAAFLTILLISCSSHSCPWELLMQVESIIEERPDSALVVLGQIDKVQLSNKEAAKHALLLSMALDKNSIDKTDFETLQPAIDYYQSRGSVTDKLRTLYYQGRICQNQGDDALAMKCYVNAIDKGYKSEDILTKARTYFAQGRIYYSLYDWDNSIDNNKNAAHLFKEAGKYNSYVNSLIYIINGYTLKGEQEKAIPYIEECKRMNGLMSLNRMGDFYSCYLTYLIKFGTENDIVAVIKEYSEAIPQSKMDWLTISNAYLNIGNYDDALRSISKYVGSSDVSKERKYKAILSDIYKKLGRYKESLETYESYISLSNSVDYDIIQQDTKFVKERYQLELQTIKERESKRSILMMAVASVILLLAIIGCIHARLKINRIKRTLAEQETEKYRLQCLQMEEERDNLTNLLAKDELEPDIKLAVLKRIELLNKFFTAYITNNSDIDKKANKELEELLANKEAFMASTKYAFAGSHPRFIKYLQEKGLTEWEINYCCLYALGLKGKEVGTYIKMRSHYNNSSNIREKLGINGHETNLGIYIRKLLKSFE